MNCPYCDKEMTKGILSGDARAGVYFKEGEKRAHLGDTIDGACRVTAAKRSLAVFTAEAFFCRPCQKMLLNTDVTT